MDKRVAVSLQYVDEDLKEIEARKQQVSTLGGTAILTVNPPEDAVGLSVEANANGAHAGFGK